MLNSVDIYLEGNREQKKKKTNAKHNFLLIKYVCKSTKYHRSFVYIVAHDSRSMRLSYIYFALIIIIKAGILTSYKVRSYF